MSSFFNLRYVKQKLKKKEEKEKEKNQWKYLTLSFPLEVHN